MSRSASRGKRLSRPRLTLTDARVPGYLETRVEGTSGAPDRQIEDGTKIVP